MEKSGGKEKGKRRSKKKFYDKNWFVVYGLRILGVSKEKINSIMNTLHDSSERVNRMDKGKKGVCSIDKVYRIKKGTDGGLDKGQK